MPAVPPPHLHAQGLTGVYDVHNPTDTKGTTMSDISKLPRWAQQRIEIAERDLAYWRAKAEDGPGESDTFIHGYGENAELAGTPLGTGTDIRFELGESTYVIARVSRRGVEIHLTQRSSSGLAVLPMSNNMVRIVAS